MENNSKTRLQLLCEAFGWQGGTIHEAKEELKRLYNMPTLPDVANMPAERFYFLLDNVELVKKIRKQGLKVTLEDA